MPTPEKKLICPVCKKPLDEHSSVWRCAKCGDCEADTGYYDDFAFCGRCGPEVAKQTGWKHPKFLLPPECCAESRRLLVEEMVEKVENLNVFPYLDESVFQEKVLISQSEVIALLRSSLEEKTKPRESNGEVL